MYRHALEKCGEGEAVPLEMIFQKWQVFTYILTFVDECV